MVGNTASYNQLTFSLSAHIFKERACMMFMSLWLLYFFLSVDHKRWLFLCWFVCSFTPRGQCQRMAVRLEEIHCFFFSSILFQHSCNWNLCWKQTPERNAQELTGKVCSASGSKVYRKSCLQCTHCGAPYKAVTFSQPERPPTYLPGYRSVWHSVVYFSSVL